MPPVDDDRIPSEVVREVRLEGATLWGALALLVALLAAAFAAGRWTAPEAASAEGNGAGVAARENAKPTEVRVEENLGFFDRAAGQGQIVEPRREASGGDSPAAEVSRPVPPAAAGEWFVQVFAGRDRQAAELVARQLRGRGHPVRLDAEREGSDSLYKVRVGGFASREAADSAAVTLRREGSSGAWVTRLGN